MGVFSKKEEIIRLNKRIEELEEENEEMKGVIRQLKENHALHVSQLKDKIKFEKQSHIEELDGVKAEYSKWVENHKGYNESMRKLNEQFMIKDIELGEIMNKIILKK